MIKRGFFLSVSCLFSIFYSRAQILVSPVLGGNVGWVVFDDKDVKDLYKVKPTLGFHAGGSISFRVQDRFFLQTSILYTQRGKILEGKLDRDMKLKARYHFIDVPILYTAEFEGHYQKMKAFKWYLGVGPIISYWLGGKGTLWHSDLNENLINPPDYKLPFKVTYKKDSASVKQGQMNISDPNRVLLGLNISAGLILEPLGYHKVMVTLRYELGHSFYSRTSKGDFGLPGKLSYQDELQVRNQGLAVSLFYFIDLKTSEKDKGKSTLKIK